MERRGSKQNRWRGRSGKRGRRDPSLFVGRSNVRNRKSKKEGARQYLHALLRQSLQGKQSIVYQAWLSHVAWVNPHKQSFSVVSYLLSIQRDSMPN
jgi:hypothetical protein